MQTAVGGYIEHVPYFDSIAYGGVVMRCVALCNENGKIDHMPLNQGATVAWERALQRTGVGTLYDDKRGKPNDWLVGSIAVLFGDREFMSEL